ncbi:hypothetical protein LUZ63_013226 [Rhynchospora breviuscula]|uniref:C2 domain-containing protein n=1 Tax=Rhynchospora breviuscula TaxID=2022672 RepID=A0A9Q0C857_9POAL|nr:hypothetical protein LUZ63_013226 [Rhynchospora breviuscula]
MPNNYHLKLDIKITKLANFIDQGSDEKLFIRYYIHAFGGNRRIQVDTREIQSRNSVMWNECASFQCHANLDQIQQLELSHITFELRSRKTRQIFGGIMTRSRLLGGGEISWKDVMDSKGMKLEKWINFTAKDRKFDGLKLPNLLVETKVDVTRDVDTNGMRKCGSSKKCDWVDSSVDMYHVETLID